METKKVCACCGNEVFVIDKQQKDNILKSKYRNASGNVKDYFLLWNFVLEMCPECHYIAKDIALEKDETKQYVNSDEYQKRIKSLCGDFSNSNLYVLYAGICEKCNDYRNAGLAYLQAEDELYENMLSSNDEAFFDDDYDYTYGEEIEKKCKALNKLAIKNLEKYLTINTDDIEINFVLFSTYLQNENDKKANSQYEKINALPLDEKQKSMLAYIVKASSVI